MTRFPPGCRIDTSPQFFEALYRRAKDPWAFASNDYEQRRYDTLIELLGAERAGCAYEPGCSVGVLTEMLAPRCDHLFAQDAAATAVERARDRCARFAHVHVCEGVLPQDLPEQRFDLVVFSELGYYFDRIQLIGLLDKLAGSLVTGGRFLSCHWLGASSDHRLAGATVHRLIEDRLGGATATITSGDRNHRYRAGLWRTTGR